MILERRRENELGPVNVISDSLLTQFLGGGVSQISVPTYLHSNKCTVLGYRKYKHSQVKVKVYCV